jgi:hypothetical protein
MTGCEKVWIERWLKGEWIRDSTHGRRRGAQGAAGQPARTLEIYGHTAP